MHILIYSSVFVRPTETFIYNTAVELQNRGHKITVLASERRTESLAALDPVHIVPPPTRLSLRRLLARIVDKSVGVSQTNADTRVHRADLKKLIRRVSPDVIIANYGPSGYLLYPIASELKIPLLVSFHGVDASSLALEAKWQKQYRSMFKDVAAATGPSVYVRNKLVELGCEASKAHVLHYGIPADRIEFTSATDRYNYKDVQFLFVGRLTEKKDPITLLRSFARARTLISPLNGLLTIAGDGPLRAQVEEEVSRLGLAKAVTLLGHLSHEEIIELYRHAHIYVQHSVTAPNGDEEGLPVSITEALAAGLPVVATQHSGIPEAVINGVNGILVPEKDIRAMAEAMAELANAPEKWGTFGAAGRKLLEDEFAVPVVQERLRLLLESVVESPDCR